MINCEQYTVYESNLFSNSIDTDYIKDFDLNFSLTRIPIGFHLLDKWMFVKSVKESINGFILDQYEIQNFIVFLYSKRTPKSKDFCILLFEKINLLKELVRSYIKSEVWVIKDDGYFCVGLVENKPIFVKTFGNQSALNDNLSFIFETMNTYSKVRSIRFFGTCAKDFGSFNCEVTNYSENVIQEAIQHSPSMDSFCKSNYNSKKRSKIVKRAQICFGILLNINSLGFWHWKNTLDISTKRVNAKIMDINSDELPIKSHYEAIKFYQNQA